MAGEPHMTPGVEVRRILTVGHGAESSEGLLRLLRAAGVEEVVDVRTAPGSRRHPQFGRQQLQSWLPEAGIAYRWEPDLGGFRRPDPHSPNVALRNLSFRGYADYMSTDRFHNALRGVLEEAVSHPTSVMCAETLWWRCHRRLIADAATLLFGFRVEHLTHDGRLREHILTQGVRIDAGAGHLVYDSEA